MEKSTFKTWWESEGLNTTWHKERESIAEVAYQAGATQAATEAAKATSVAVGELPKLPEAFGELHYQREVGFAGRVHGYTSKQMRAYGQACAKAARQPAPVAAIVNEAARLIQLWLMDDDVRRAMGEPYNRDAARKITAWPDLLREAIPFEAALAATAAPVLSDEQINDLWNALPGIEIHNKASAQGMSTDYALRIAFAKAIIAATRSQP